MMIGQRIRELRKEKKWTQQDLADKLGLVKSTISQYETGTNQPDHDTENAIADLFGVTLDYLRGRSDSPHMTEKQQWELNLQVFKEIVDKLSRGERGDIPESNANGIMEYLSFQIAKIEEMLSKQK